MSSKSNWMETDVLTKYYGSGAPTVYLALYSTNPTDADTGTELTGGGYARLACTPGTDLTVTGNTMTNANAKSFTESTGSQGTASHFGFRTANTAGNLLHYGPLGTSRAVTSAGITVTFPANSITVTED